MEKDAKHPTNDVLTQLIDSISNIESRIHIMDGNFMKKIGEIDAKVTELEDMTKEFLGEDDEAQAGDATAGGAEGGEMGDEDEEEDFFKVAEKRKDNEKHVKFCPYIEKYNDNRGHQLVRPMPLSKLSGLRYARQYIYWTMHDESFSMLSYCIFMVVMIMILVSTCAYVLATIPDLEDWEGWALMETIVSLAFTVEYVLRVLVVRDRLHYCIEIMNFIDFLAVIPWWLELAFQTDGAVLRMIRVVRLARISRLRTSANVSEYIEVMKTTLVKTFKESFGMLSALLFLEVIVFSSLIYVAENGKDHPGQSNGFTSIPYAMWWCVVTITTVGYGDMYPVSVAGKIIGCITTFTGLVVMAIFVIIIGGNFEKIYKDYQRRKRKFTKKATDKQKKESDDKDTSGD